MSRGLRIRTGLYLACLAAIVTAAIAWLVLSELRGAVDSRWNADLEQRLERADAELDRQTAALDRSLELLADELTTDAVLLRRLFLGGPGVADVAVRLAGLSGLDRLWILDETGRVLSSAHWPQQAGMREPGLSPALLRAGATTWIASPEGGGLVRLGSRPVAVGERRVDLIGGTLLDRRFLERVAEGQPAVLFADRAGSPLTVGDLAGFDVAAASRITGDELPLTIPSSTGGAGWIAGLLPLEDESGSPVGKVLLALARDDLVALQRRLRTGFALLGGMAIVAAALAGAWIAGRLTRPVSRLVQAVDAIASGEADYSFPRRPRDELDQVADSFSRLQRSLEVQRARSLSAERVAAWREVARRVAHEVKNPLAPIQLTIQNLERVRQRDPQQFEQMFADGARTILEEVDQLKRLVSEFSEFARLPAPRRSPVQLHSVLDDVLDLYASTPQLKIVREYALDLPPLDLDVDQISRALKNLVGNAVEAMQQAGLDSPRLEVRTILEPPMVLLEIRDNGPGFGDEIEGKMFQPYVTTKSGGTGLGLAITDRIVTEHGGVISSENVPQGGALVVVRLPLALPHGEFGS